MLKESVEDETEDVCDDDIDEMLAESKENYELATLVKDSINHLVNDLGEDPMDDDFGDNVCADLENNYDIDVPQDMVRYADWCDAVMSEVSRQVNKVEELTEASQRDLDRVAAKIQQELPKGYTATGNRSHACVDIKNSDGKVVGQAYPDYSEVEKEYKTLKRVSKDDIEDDDIIYVKRNKTGMRRKMDGIKFVKSVNNIYDTFDSFKNSLK